MSVQPQFMPANAPGSAVASGLDALNSARSYMDRVSQNRRAEEVHKIKMRETAILMPVIQAKARAEEARANAEVSGLVQTEQSRAWANEILPQSRQEFDSILQIPVVEDREQAAIEYAGKYSQLANIKELSGEMRAKLEIVASIISDAQGLRRLKEQSQARLNEIDALGRAKVAEIGARNANPARNEFMSLMQGLSEAKTAGDAEAETFYRDRLNKLSYISPARKQKVEALLELRRQAEEDWDDEAVLVYNRAIEKETTITTDPVKAAIASKIQGSAATPAPATPRPAAVVQPKASNEMSDEELEAFMLGGE